MTTLGGFSHVALTVTDIQVSRDFYARVLGMQLLDSSETYCAFLTGSERLSALILTSHESTIDEPFTEFRPGLDHVSLNVADLAALDGWQARLRQHGVASDLRRSEWGYHLNFRDPDNIAVELVVLAPDTDIQNVLDRADVQSDRSSRVP
jgi:glyoxylase I family protein